MHAPPIISPTRGIERSLPDAASRLEDAIHEALRAHGAVVLRGFLVGGARGFTHVLERLFGALGSTYEGPSPRARIHGAIHEASRVPPSLAIPAHSEMSYLPRPPRWLSFWCRRPASLGGATTLTDGAAVCRALDSPRLGSLLNGSLRIRRRHAAPRGARDPFELRPWSELFDTEQPDVALERAERAGMSAVLEDSGAITLTSEQPSVRVHPESNTQVWANHLLVFHASTPRNLLAAAARDGHPYAALAWAASVAKDHVAPWLGRVPAMDVTRGDGSPIPTGVVDHVRETVASHTHDHTWRREDVVLLDNLRILHGRRPFRGERSVAVAWSAS